MLDALGTEVLTDYYIFTRFLRLQLFFILVGIYRSPFNFNVRPDTVLAVVHKSATRCRSLNVFHKS